MSEVSIVIPIYNTEEYLRECLDSVVNQTLRNIEIILVDDGSTDGSVDICREYAKRDSRIYVITQENAGPAAARRTGAKVATSPYIGFVDSDDFLEADMYEALYSHIDNCDLVTASAYKEEGGILGDHLKSGHYSGCDEMQYVIDNMIMMGDTYIRGISAAIHCKLYRTDMAKTVFDYINPKIYYGEDAEFIFRYILLCKSICVSDICKYHYRARQGSLVHSGHADFMINLNLLYLSLNEAFKGHPREARLIEQLQMFIANYFNTLSVRMGFVSKVKALKYVNPLFNELLSNKIALYGAGVVGRDYYLHLLRQGRKPVIWVDKECEKYQKEYPVRPVEELECLEYDALLIAVKNQDLAEKIKCELMRKGIDKEKILWKEPVRIV